jgi:hypothetical protein
MKRIVLVSLLCAVSVSASAEMKHVKFTTPVIIDGQPVVDEVKCPIIPTTGKRECQTPFTVGEMAYLSLERPPAGGVAQQSWTDAIKHDELAHAVRNADDFPLLDDQRISIEAAMAPLWSPLILGFVNRVIDPPTSTSSK